MTKILIVDDDPDMVEAGRIVLEAGGYEVISAGNVPNGLEALEEVQPDLLILDVMMEEVDDGLVMARQIRRQGRDLPILMLTSVNRAMGLSIEKDEEIVPVDEFLEKPVDPTTLLEKVKVLLESRGVTPC